MTVPGATQWLRDYYGFDSSQLSVLRFGEPAANQNSASGWFYTIGAGCVFAELTRRGTVDSLLLSPIPDEN